MLLGSLVDAASFKSNALQEAPFPPLLQSHAGGGAIFQASEADRNSCKTAPCALAGRVWAMARDPQGCREVQRAFEIAQTEGERVAMGAELQGHVWDAMRCPHANYVLQKAIALMKPQGSQFIIDEVVRKGARAVAQAARHKYGCRIVQRLLEHCTAAQVSELAAAILQDSLAIARHPYGNYVMQHIIEHGTKEQRGLLTRQLEQQAAAIGADEYACAVVGKALAHGEQQEKLSLARALARVPGMVCALARTRHGHVAARLVLQTLEGTEYEEASVQLRSDAASLRGSRYSRTLVASLDHCGNSRPSSQPWPRA